MQEGTFPLAKERRDFLTENARSNSSPIQFYPILCPICRSLSFPNGPSFLSFHKTPPSFPSRLKMNIIRNTGSSRSMAKVIRSVPTASPNFPPDLCVLSIGLENSFFIIFFLREQNSCYEGLFFVEGYIRPCILLKYERDTRDLHRNAKGGSFAAQPSRSKRLKSNRNVQKVYKIRK